jgi:hypothetical protein
MACHRRCEGVDHRWLGLMDRRQETRGAGDQTHPRLSIDELASLWRWSDVDIKLNEPWRLTASFMVDACNHGDDIRIARTIGDPIART